MELWIRSQDKRHLIKADYVSIMENNIINVASSGWDYDVAKYKSKERALEVLDEIAEYINNDCKFIEEKTYTSMGTYTNKITINIYQMPKE